MQSIVLVVHNVRSTHNVGSIMRTAEGLGIKLVYLTGYTPYPFAKADRRLPHISQKIDRQIAKTALGAEKLVKWKHRQNVAHLLKKLAEEGFVLTALEQTSESISLVDYKPRSKIALLVGSEIGGIGKDVLDLCDVHLHIPMAGRKESFNVAVATGIALYQLRYG